MPVTDTLINNASGNKMISFLDGNVGYNKIFMAKEDIHKTTFWCPGFIGLFEWVVMMFGLKNAGDMYQRAMNLIFHDLLGGMMEVYIDDVVIKSVGFEEHLADLCIALERMKRYDLRMNPFKCAFGVSAGHFLGFIMHEHGIQINPKKIESIHKLEETTCKRDVQKLMRKINYLRRFIANLPGKIDPLLPLVHLKHERDFKWGDEQRSALKRIEEYLSKPHVLRAPKVGKEFKLYMSSQDKVIGGVLT
jgi:hypothetical protein